MNLQEELSAAFLVHGEVIADCGEDNYTMGSGSDSFYYIGAFDGCGGLGAQQYESFGSIPVLGQRLGWQHLQPINLYRAVIYSFRKRMGRLCSSFCFRSYKLQKRLVRKPAAYKLAAACGKAFPRL